MLRNLLLAAALLMPAVAVSAIPDEWPPVTPEELALKQVPGFPGEHALILHREVDAGEKSSHSRHYSRLKILTEEGRKYADVEIPYWGSKVEDVRARTIRPDGSVVNFTGQIYDKTVLQAKGLRISVKSFTLPEVQPGSIIEYQYRVKQQTGTAPVWEVQDQLFTRRATYSWKPSGDRLPRWVSYPDQIHPVVEGKVFHLRLESIPPFPQEDFMPPPGMIKARIEFYYAPPAGDWFLISRFLSEAVDRFAGKAKKLEGLVGEIAPASDPPDQRLRKLYARAQQIRNVNYEPSGGETEKLKANGSAEDVLKRGYGTGYDINLLLLALVRAAGYNAHQILVTTRDRRLFNQHVLSMDQLNAWLIEARAGGKLYYLDPGTRFCPFGLVPWNQTAAGGIRVSGESGVFVETPQPVSSDAVVERSGLLELDAEGALGGNIEVAFRGQEALDRRMSARKLDEAGRRKSMEAEVKGWFLSGASVTVDRITGWEGSQEPLSVVLTVRIPDFASVTGRRLLLPATLFRGGYRDLFSSSSRVHPIYFPYPYREQDRIQVRLPEGYRIENVPLPHQSQSVFGKYELTVRAESAGVLTLERRFVLDGYYIRRDSYAALREFYAEMRKSDEQQLVFQSRR